MRNTIGNALQATVNATADGIAVELDRIISMATGERTRAHISATDRIAGWHAFARETQNTFLDFFTDRTITQHGEYRFNLNQRGRVFQGQIPETLRLIEGFLMSVGDRNFWRKAYGSTAVNIGNAVMSSAISQNVPSVISQLATALDPYVRDTKDKNMRCFQACFKPFFSMKVTDL